MGSREEAVAGNHCGGERGHAWKLRWSGHTLFGPRTRLIGVCALKYGETGRGGERGFDYFNASNLAPAGALVESAFEIGEDVGRAFGESLHATVVEIADPATEATRDGLALDEITETDSLHLAADEISAALGHVGYASGGGAEAAFFTSR